MRSIRIAVVLIIASVFAVSSPAEVMKFDFGSKDSPAAEGFMKVTPESAWSDAAAFGWKTKLRVVPKVDNWWNADEKGGVLTGFDTTKGTDWGRDYCLGFHFFGWKHTDEDKQGVNRLGIKMDDDLAAEFVVKVAPGKHSILLAAGDLGVDHRFRPFSIAVNGKPLLQRRGPATLTVYRMKDIDCPDGALTISFAGDVDYKHPYPWNQCTWWMVNYLLVAPDAAQIDATLADLETKQFDTLKAQYIPEGPMQRFELRDGCLWRNGRPFLRLLFHGWGWDDPIKYYRLYAWTNTINLGKSTKFFYYEDWFRDGWRERAKTGAFPSDWFADAKPAWENGYLVNYYFSREALQYLPSNYRKDHPDAVAVDKSGRKDGYNRYLGEPGGDLYTARNATVLADLAKLHPASCSVEIFEEYWVADIGFNPRAMTEYRNWLKAKYGDLDKLNAEWGTNYASFDEIVPPKEWEATGNYVNHMLWKGAMNARIAKIAYDAFKEANPGMLCAGAKGQFGTASWFYAPATDIFGWYGHANMDLARAAAEQFGKALDPVHVNVCQHQTMRGGKPVSTYPFMNYRQAAYSLMITRMIDGAKAIFNEDYVLGHDFHYFHRTKAMRGQKLEGTLGGKVELDRDDYPDVYLESKSLQLARANQMMLRLAPLFLPAKVPRARVALLATVESSFGGGPNPFYSNQSELPNELLKRLQLPYDVLRRPQFDRMKDYDLIVLTPLALALTPDDAQKVKDFVAAGGRLLILPPAAEWDARTLKGTRFGFEQLAGCAVSGKTACGGDAKINVTGNAPIRSMKQGDTLPGLTQPRNDILAALDVNGATVLAESGGKPVAAISADGKVATVCLPQNVSSWGGIPAEHLDERTVKFFGDLLDSWKISRPVTLTGDGEPWMIDAGVLEGKDYHLVLFANYSESAQKVMVKLNFLPDTTYDIIDVTGERPLIAKDATGQNRLQPDPKYRGGFYLARAEWSKDFAAAGFGLEIGPLMGRVLLIRPAKENVWVNCPESELKAIASEGVIIVPGMSDASRKAVEVVEAALRKKRIAVSVVPPSDVKIRSFAEDVIIDGFKVDSFKAAPPDVKQNVIFIGLRADNPMLRHIQSPDAFCFDKVLQKASPEFPGAGRGIIEVVESVNNEAYDWTARSRDAILVVGSDPEGLAEAAKRFVEIIGREGELR